MTNYRFVANMNMNVDKGQLENLLCPPWLDWNLSMIGNNELWPNLVHTKTRESNFRLIHSIQTTKIIFTCCQILPSLFRD